MTWDEWTARGLNGVENECGQVRNSFPSSITFSNGWVASIVPSFELGYTWSVATCDWNGCFDWDVLNPFGAVDGMFQCKNEEEVAQAIEIISKLNTWDDGNVNGNEKNKGNLVPCIPSGTTCKDGTTRPVAIAVDFDGTLCTNKWPEIGEPNEALLDMLIGFRSNGGELILWTNREGETLEQAVAFCKEHGLEFDAMNENLPSWKAMFKNDTRKVGADYYLDDKAICVKANYRK